MSIQRASRRPVLVVLALAFGLVLGGVAPASGQTSGSTSELKDGGVLRLQLGAGDHFRFQPPDGAGGYLPFTAQQSISTSSGCRLALGGAPLVSFSSSGNFVGFVDDGIGVRSSGEGNGQPCGLIDGDKNEKLTMRLESALDGKVIDFAEVDVEGKFGVSFKIEGFLGSSTTPLKTEMYSTAPAGSDSGPDSGDGDNFRVRFPRTGTTTVDRLVFSIVGTTGSASLHGGADGTAACDTDDSAACNPSLGNTIDPTPTSDSLFHLLDVDGLLDCDDNGAGGVTQGGDGTPTTTIERFDNRDGSQCVAIPFNQDSFVEGTNQFIVFQKDLLSQPTAQFLWTAVWVAEGGQYQETETQFDFGNGFQPLQLCLADSNGDGLPELPPSVADPTENDPWCVVNTSTDLVIETGQVIVTETFYGFGDPTGRR